MSGLRKKVDIVLLMDHGVSIRSPLPPFVDAERDTFSTFSFFIIIFTFFSLRSVICSGQRLRWRLESPGLQPIIRKENGMNCKASFHWEMPKYRHIMDTQAEVEGCRDINWPAVWDGILWSHSGSPRMMAGRHYTAPTVSSPLQVYIDKC